MMDAAMHGWSGIAFAYAAVQVPMIAALIRARSAFQQYAIAPIAALPLTAVAAAGSALFAPHGVAHAVLAVGASALLGYAGGEVLAQDAAAGKVHRRGAHIAERAASGASKSDAGVSLAGLRVPAADETKHFKLIGTTGTGKSTAIQELMSQALGRGDRAVIADPDRKSVV